MRKSWLFVAALVLLSACAAVPAEQPGSETAGGTIAEVSGSPNDTQSPTPSFSLSPLPATAPGGTRLQLFDWRRDLDLGSAPKLATADSCWEAVTSSRGDAFRCIESTGALSDPCYIGDGGMVCPDGPFEKTYRLLTMPPEQLELTDRINVDFPWGVAIAKGDKCSAVAGAGEPRQGLRFNFRCAHGMLWGDIDRSKPVWRIRWSADWNSPFQWVKITAAVY